MQCLYGQPNFFINIQFKLPGERLPVTYRLDDGEPVKTVWKIDYGHITIVPKEMEGFVRPLLGKQKLELTLEFPNGPNTTNFEIAHLHEVSVCSRDVVRGRNRSVGEVLVVVKAPSDSQ